MNSVWRSYRYRAFNVAGDLVNAEIEANSQAHARELLWLRGLTPLTAYPAGGDDATPWWRREFSLSSHPSAKAAATFTREFAVLCEAGLPIDGVLRILNDQTASKSMKIIVREMSALVQGGSLVSDALAHYPRTFGSDYLSVLRAGERTGKMAQALREIADLLEQRLTVRDKVRSALVYPCILLVMAAVSIAVIMGVLIPSIAPIFSQNGKELPSVMAALLWMQSHWLMLAVVLGTTAASTALLALVLVRSREGRLLRDRILLLVPGVGTLILQRDTERFARTLGALLRARVSLLAAFSSAKDVVQNRVLEVGLSNARDAIEDGGSLYDALRTHTRLPHVALQMIAVGESSGKIEDMLQRLAINMAYLVQQRIDRFMTLLTPALTIGIAGLIGAIVMTTMNAILSINDLALR